MYLTQRLSQTALETRILDHVQSIFTPIVHTLVYLADCNLSKGVAPSLESGCGDIRLVRGFRGPYLLLILEGHHPGPKRWRVGSCWLPVIRRFVNLPLTNGSGQQSERTHNFYSGRSLTSERDSTTSVVEVPVRADRF